MGGPLSFQVNPTTGRAIPGTQGARALFWERLWALFRAYQGGGAGSVARSFCCFLAEVACDVFIELERMADAELTSVDETAVGRAFDMAPDVVENVGAVPRVIVGRDEGLVRAYNPHNHPRCSCYRARPERLMHYPSPQARQMVVEFLAELQQELEARSESLPVNVEANLLLWAAEEADFRLVAADGGSASVVPSLAAVRRSLPVLLDELSAAMGDRL